MIRFSGVFGFFLVLTIIVGDIVIAGEIFIFDMIYIPAFMVCFFGTIGLCYISYGALDTLRAISSIRYIVVAPQGTMGMKRSREVLSGAIIHMYAAGMFGSAIGFFKMFSVFAVRDQAVWGYSPILLAFLPLFYALMFSEFILRPAARRLETYLLNSLDS